MFKKRAKVFSLIIILINLVINTASSEIVNKINVTGNDRISDQTIIMFSGINLNDELNLNDLDQILKKIYESNFFDNVNVSLNNNILSIEVFEKPIIETIRYDGVKSDEIRAEIIKTRILKPRSSYDELSLAEDRNKIFSKLKDLGYYFASIDTQVETLDKNKLNLIYTIEKGKKSKIKKITFVGNKIFKDKKLKNIIISEEYKFWKFISGKKFLNEGIIDLDKRLLKNFYLNKGYRDVLINSSFAKFVNENEFELIYNINAKNKFFFNDIKFDLTDDYDEENFSHLEKHFAKIKDKPYSINIIRDIIEKFETIALTEQFESVKITPLESIDGNRINLVFKFQETEKFFVEKINIFGNNVTQENVIRNQFEIDEGDPYNEILYNKTINNIKSLGFFSSTNAEVQPGSQFNSKVINFSVEEKATGEISLGAGAGTSGATIGFGVKENNFLGKGINLDAFATLTEETAKGKFSIKNPNFRNSDKSITTSVEALEIDRTSTTGYKTNKTGFTFGTNFEFYDDLNLGLGLSNFYEKIETDSTASALQKTQDGNYWDSFVAVNFDYDKRDQKFQTTDGFRSYYSVNLPMLSDTGTLTNSYSFNHYSELFNENLTNTSFYLAAANSIIDENIKLSERLYVPSRKLRGFERGRIGPKDGNDYVGGNFITTANITTTLPQLMSNLQQVDFIMFMDAANVWGVDYDSSIDDEGSIRSSIGLGIDWMTPIGPLNFTFAQPLTKETTDQTETFRFNIGTSF
ncbi:outer membrane protein assembly factor BamA [Pelagibacterales bacterium SAG-MED22]|nr:outer membrane protein assembly factor BamA [Pelagibacterales bacterium SAG-MED22]